MPLPNVFPRGTAFLAIIVAAIGTACGGAPDRRYELSGQVLSIAPDRSEATIKHKDIPNLMSGMTMPFKVRDAKELESVEPGDLITATLVVEANGAYITGIERVGEAPIEPAPQAPSASSGFELLKPGESVLFYVHRVDAGGNQYVVMQRPATP